MRFETYPANSALLQQRSGRYSTLDRFEFEESLIALAVRGGCHRATASVPQEHIRSVVASGLSAAFSEPFDDVHVFRLDDEKWCQATDEATISSSYAVWQSARGLWWVLCVADID